MRLNTPSPSQSSRSSRSPHLPAGTSASGSASASNRSRSVEPTLSGSQTKRELSPSYSYYSSDDQSVTSPSSVSQAYSILDGQLRRISLPASPAKGKAVSSIRSYSPNSSQKTPRKRVSTMSVPGPDANHGHTQNNINLRCLVVSLQQKLIFYL